MSKKTLLEIDELKAGWASDPCFDIEDTEGFEDVREELLQFRQEMELKWKQREEQERNKLAETLGFRVREQYEFGVQFVLDPAVFTDVMAALLNRMHSLEDRLERAEIKLDKIGRG
jgi:hypothetical protein